MRRPSIAASIAERVTERLESTRSLSAVGGALRKASGVFQSSSSSSSSSLGLLQAATAGFGGGGGGGNLQQEDALTMNPEDYELKQVIGMKVA